MLDLLPSLVLKIISSAHYEGKQIVDQIEQIVQPKYFTVFFSCLGHTKEQQISVAVGYGGGEGVHGKPLQPTD